MQISASQIRMFCWSKAKRAGQYILGIKDEIKNDALRVWKAVEDYMLNPLFHDLDTLLKWVELEDKEKAIQTYEDCKFNARWVLLPIWEVQKEIKWEICGVDYIGYIDNYKDWIIYELKTAQYLTDKDKEWSKNMWSWLSTIEEYKLQLWMYMRVLKCNGRIVEIAKHRYKDWLDRSQFIDFERSEDFDKEMLAKYTPIINEMKELYEKFWKQEENKVLI